MNKDEKRKQMLENLEWLKKDREKAQKALKELNDLISNYAWKVAIEGGYLTDIVWDFTGFQLEARLGRSSRNDIRDVFGADYHGSFSIDNLVRLDFCDYDLYLRPYGDRMTLNKGWDNIITFAKKYNLKFKRDSFTRKIKDLVETNQGNRDRIGDLNKLQDELANYGILQD